MDLDQEELVKLIFGPNEPDNWRENPDFLLYLSELGYMGAERLISEPERVAEDLHNVQAQTQELAFSNYKTFIQTSNCSKEIFSEFGNTEQHLEQLVSQLPGFIESCKAFQSRANEISTHRRLTSLTLSKHNSLLEILELPQLMDTVVRNQHYDEALELYTYVSKLARKQPDICILEDIGRNVANSLRLMLQQLLSQLRAPIQLPQCLKVISYLRRMDIFTETELRLKFLQARETWLQSVRKAVPRDDAYTHISRTMEVMRVHLFDVVTQYRAIFSDDTLLPAGQQDNVDNRLLFTSWFSKKVEEFLVVLERDLEADVGSLESILGQAMYFGLSFSRVGFDFRPLLVPIFEKAVRKQFLKHLDTATTLKHFTNSLATLNLQKLAQANTLLKPMAEMELRQPPLELLDFLPLARVCNSVLAALNAIRLCAPVSLAGFVAASISDLLGACSDRLAVHHHQATWGDTQRRGYLRFCATFKRLLLPYLSRCLSAVFPSRDMAAISGLAVADLQARGLGFLDATAIMLPLDALLQPLEEEEAAALAADRTEHASAAVTAAESLNSERTDYVAEKMADLATEVDSCEAADVPVLAAISSLGTGIAEFENEISAVGQEGGLQDGHQQLLTEAGLQDGHQQLLTEAANEDATADSTAEANTDSVAA